MMKYIRNMFLACGVVAMGLPSVSAMATENSSKADIFANGVQLDFYSSANQRNPRQTLQYAQQQSRPSVSPSQAKSIALRRNPGARFIDVQLRGNQYRVRLQLKNGRIKDVYVDARRR